MSEIPVYNAGGGTPPTELRPNPAGVEATAQAGWRIGRAFDQSGADIGRSIAAGGEAFQQHVASQEITQLAPLLAAHRAQRDAAWNAATSQPDFDPFNPTARINAMQTIATDYSNLEKGVTTKIAKDYLQKDMLQETERFNMQTIGDIAQLSANKTLDGAIKTSNIYLQNITDNPSSLDANIGGIHSYVQSMIQLYGAQMGVKGIDQMHTWEREQETAYTVRAYEASFSRATTPEAVDAISAALQGDTTHSEFLDQEAVKGLQGDASSRKDEIIRDDAHNQVAAAKALHLKGEQGLNALRSESEVDDGHGGVMMVVPQNATQRLNQWREDFADDPGSATEADALQARWETATQNAKDGKNVIDDNATKTHFTQDWGKFKKSDIDFAEAHNLLTHTTAEILRGGAIDSSRDPREDAGIGQLNTLAGQYQRVFNPGGQDANGQIAYNNWYQSHVLGPYLAARKADPTGDPAEQARAIFDNAKAGNAPSYVPHYRAIAARPGVDLSAVPIPASGGAGASVQTGAPTSGTVRQPGESDAAFAARLTAGQ